MSRILAALGSLVASFDVLPVVRGVELRCNVAGYQYAMGHACDALKRAGLTPFRLGYSIFLEDPMSEQSRTDTIELMQREIKARCKRERRRPDLAEGCVLRVKVEDRSVDPLADRAGWRAWLDRQMQSDHANDLGMSAMMHIHLVATQGQIRATSPNLPAWW